MMKCIRIQKIKKNEGDKDKTSILGHLYDNRLTNQFLKYPREKMPTSSWNEGIKRYS